MKNDLPVTLHIPVNQTCGNASAPAPTHVAVSIKSDIMDSYENGWPLGCKEQVQSVVLPKAGLVNLSIGTDGSLYLIRKDPEGKEYWLNIDIGAQVLHRLAGQAGEGPHEILHFDVIHADPANDDGEGLAIVLCTGEKDKPETQQIWLTKRFDPTTGAEGEWHNLGNIAGVGVEFLRLGRRPHYDNKADEEPVLVALGRKDGGRVMDVYLYTPQKNDWEFMQMSEDIDSITDLRYGVSPIQGFGAYVLGSYRGSGRLVFTPFFDEKHAFRPSPLNSYYPFTSPGAFVTHTIDDPESDYNGCSDVYAVDIEDDGTNRIKYMSAAAQDFERNSGGATEIVTISSSFSGEVRKIFFTKGGDRIDLYTHVLEKGSGKLLHTFSTNGVNADLDRWCPMYTLQQNTTLVSPAGNADGRICEVFLIGSDNNDLCYLWQDDKLYSWNRDTIRVRATDKAVPTRTAQSKITFTDPKTGAPFIFQQLENPGTITIESSASVNLQINSGKYILNAHEPVALDAKSIPAELLLVTNITEADTPRFKLTADVFENGEITVYPIAKVKDDLARITSGDIQQPRDRYGDSLKAPLVDEAHSSDEYLNGVLPGIRKTASLTADASDENHLHLLAAPVSADRMNREGVWFQADGTPFDSRIDLASLPEGPLFAIDFSEGHPRYLDRNRMLSMGVTGISGYNGFWDDLAKFFGPLIEAVKNSDSPLVRFVAEVVSEGVAITIHFLEETVHCVVQFVEQAMKTINMVLEKYLGIDLEKLMAWLGVIFDAEYIAAIQEQLVGMMHHGIDTIKQSVGGAEEQVTSFFEKLKRDVAEGMAIFTADDTLWTALTNNDAAAVSRIFAAHDCGLNGTITIRSGQDRQSFTVEDDTHSFVAEHCDDTVEVRFLLQVPKDIRDLTLSQAGQEIKKKADGCMGQTSGEKEKNWQLVSDRQDSLKNDPVLHWPMEQIKLLPSLGFDSIGIFDVEQTIIDQLQSFFLDELIPLAESSEELIEDKLSALWEYVEDPDHTLGELFEFLGKNILQIGFDLTEKIIVALLKIVDALVGAFESMATSELNIPVVKELYKLICGPDARFSLVNASALLIAIPTAVFCKLAGIKVQGTNPADGEPAWWHQVKNWAGLVLNGIQVVVSSLAVVANWITAADPSGEAGKVLNSILGAFSSGIITPLKLFFNNPYLLQPLPQTDIAWADWIVTQARWWTQVVDCLVGQALLLLSSALPAYAKKIIGLVVSCLAFWLYLAESFALWIIKMIRSISAGDAWQIVDCILAFAENTLGNFGRVYVALGNLIPVLEEISALGKTAAHLVGIVSLDLGLLDQLTRTIINTVVYEPSR